MSEKRRIVPAWLLFALALSAILVGGVSAEIDTAQSQTFTSIYELAGTVAALDANESHLFVGDDDTLRIFNVADPAAPVELSAETVEAGASIQRVIASGDFVHITTSTNRNYVYSVSDPAAPILFGDASVTIPSKRVAAIDNTFFDTAVVPGSGFGGGGGAGANRIDVFLLAQTAALRASTSPPFGAVPSVVSNALFEYRFIAPPGTEATSISAVEADGEAVYAAFTEQIDDAGDFVGGGAFNVFEDGLRVRSLALPAAYDHDQLFKVFDGVQYVADQGVTFFDVSGSSYDELGRYESDEIVAFTAVQGVLFSISSDGQLNAVDVSDFAAPIQFADTIINAPAADIAANQNAVFVAKGASGVEILMLEEASEPPIDYVCGAPGLASSYWDEVYGTSLDEILTDPRYPNMPTEQSVIRDFDAPRNIGNFYVKRFVGYIQPPVSGEYRFHIASDDNSELRLGSSGAIDSAVAIASVPEWTNELQWDKYPSQRSNLIALEAGELYYVETLFKEFAGNDHLTVGWEVPGGDGTIEIIGEEYLCQLTDAAEPLSAEFTRTPQGGIAPFVATFDAGPSTGDIVSYDWDLGNGNTASGIVVSDTYSIPGSYTITLTVTSSSGNTASAAREIFAIEPTDPVEDPCVAHGLSREFWYQVEGAAVSDLTSLETYPSSPSMRDTIVDFNSQPNGDYYGSRVRGFIEPAMTGDYTFWLASDDNGELRLSSDSNPANLQTIATVSDWTAPQAYDWYEEQQSEPIYLEAGKRYFVEALQKESAGNDHLSVAWAQPGMDRALITQAYLCTDPEIEGLPVASFTHVPVDGVAPVSVSFDASGSFDPNGNVVSYDWMFSDGGSASGPLVDYLFERPGMFNARLTVTDNAGNTSSSDVIIDIGTANAVCGGESVLYERWTDIDGSLVSDLTSSPRFLEVPDQMRVLYERFETDNATAEYYGARMSGYLVPSVSAEYTFYIASDDQAVLHLSTNDDATNLVQIASVPDWVSSREYDWYAEQTSAPVMLEAGERYYIEVLHKEGFGGDHVAVAWNRAETTRTEIDADYLCPAESDWDDTPATGRRASGRSAVDDSRQVALAPMARDFPVALYDDAFVVLMRDGGLRARILALQVWADALLASGETVPQAFVDEAEVVVLATASLGSDAFAEHLMAHWNVADLAGYVGQPARDAYDAINAPQVPTQVGLVQNSAETPSILLLTLLLIAAAPTVYLLRRK